MTLELDHVGIGEEPGAALPVVSAVAAPGRPGVIAVETEQAPVLASLVAGGRMRVDTGRVLLDGHEDAAAIRRTFALVDTPGVAEPFPVMSLTRIVREELAFAGQRPSREHVDTVLDELGLRAYADTHVQRVPTGVRIRLLVELALLRDGVTGIVVTSPERHGGAVEDWFTVVRDVARRGITVVVVTSKAAASTVERLLDTVGDADPAGTVAATTTADRPDTTQTEGPDDATRTDGDDPRLPSDPEAPATVPTEAPA
jgi:ABC-2 type transport system ATP-binding protein